MNSPRKKNRTKLWHKWLGLILAFFALMFAISGIILNHRALFSGMDVSRKYLPDYLSVKNWNQSSIKTTLDIGGDSLLMYGTSGIWLTNQRHTFIERFETGMKKGVDNRNVAKIVKTKNDDVFAVTTFDLYQLDKKNNAWNNITRLIDSHERLSDAAVSGDTLVVLSRSELFISTYPYKNFSKSEISAPENYTNTVSLFRTIWRLHSGELFGETGKIIIDLSGVCLIILSVTGIIIFLFPKLVRRLKQSKKKVSSFIAVLRPSYKWHGKLGYWFTALFLLLFISGTFLRPPLLISIIRSNVKPVLFSTLDSKNAWNDRLRCINYDTLQNEWILYTSEGFFSMDNLQAQPRRIQGAPQVSVMGVGIMQQTPQGSWIVGSFDGLVLWDRNNALCIDYLTGRPLHPRHPGPPRQQVAVTGFSADFLAGDVAFGYAFGAQYLHRNGQFIAMPEIDAPDKISLWHLALEVHTGRIYQSLTGPLSGFFIFLSGLSMTIITISGLIVYRRKKKRSQKQING